MIRRSVALLAVILLVACGGDAPTIVGLPYSDYAHEDEPFARELFSEHSSKIDIDDDPELFFVWGETDQRYTHVTGGARLTPTSVPGAPVVWFMGGSTMFGIGQRDEHTIASEVARIAADAGMPIDARNYGTSAYVGWQEAGLLRRLMAREDRPDLIVFLHGVNDFSQTCRHLAAGIDPMSRTNPLTDAPIDPDGPQEFNCWDDPSAGGAVVASVLDASMAEAASVADGVPIVEFWQATAYTRKPSPTDAELLEHLDETRYDFDRSGAVYRAAISADAVPGVDLTDVFDDHEGPVFFDWAHTNELGARLLAEAMWERRLRDEVEQLG